jgi:hypothetical protein
MIFLPLWLAIIILPLLVLEWILAGIVLWIRFLIRSLPFVLVYFLLAMTAQAEPLDEVNLQRSRIGLPPLIRDEALCKFAQAKAEYQAARNIWGHAGPRWGEVGVTEGTGVTRPENTQGWLSCACDKLGQWPAGAGAAYDSSGRRFNCLLIRCPNGTRESSLTQTYLIPTYHLSPRPIRYMAPRPSLVISQARRIWILE